MLVSHSWDGLKLFLELARAFERKKETGRLTVSTQCAFISRTPLGPKIQLPVVRRGAIAVQLC